MVGHVEKIFFNSEVSVVNYLTKKLHFVGLEFQGLLACLVVRLSALCLYKHCQALPPIFERLKCELGKRIDVKKFTFYIHITLHHTLKFPLSVTF